MKTSERGKKKIIIITIFIMLILINISNTLGTEFLNEKENQRITEWDVILNFTESGGKNDWVIFGEALDASDGVDGYDAPNPPGGVPPFLDAYFTTNFLWPFNSLMQEIKAYPDSYKIWNLTVYWNGANTNVIITWNTADVSNSEYSSVLLCDEDGYPLCDMITENSYIFFYTGNNYESFQIICYLNIPPTAFDDAYFTDEDTPLNIPTPGVLGNDIDIGGPDDLIAFLVNDTSHGSLILNSNGSFKYNPYSDWSGNDYFTYYAFDGEYNSNIATVSINVAPINDDPIVNNDFVSVEQYSSYNQIDVLGNDFDIDGDVLEIIYVTNPLHGNVLHNKEYVFYEPNEGYFGDDFFAYTITDNNGSLGVSGNVYVTVVENIPPNKPDRPDGETQGAVGIEYTYTTKTIDSNNDSVFYFFSWGDGTTTGWIGPYDSGILISANHSWEKKGNYEIKVKSMDEYGKVSEWSDPLPITMPFLQNFSFANKIITFFLKIIEFFSDKISNVFDYFLL